MLHRATLDPGVRTPMMKLMNGMWHVFELVKINHNDGTVRSCVGSFGSREAAEGYLQGIDLVDLLGTTTFRIDETWTNKRPEETRPHAYEPV